MQQDLFEITTRDGAVVALVRLESQQCAIEQDGELVNTYAPDDDGVRRAVKQYFKTVDEHGGARHPFQAMDGLCDHPHAG